MSAGQSRWSGSAKSASGNEEIAVRLGGVLPGRLYFWLSIGIRLAPPDAVSLEELSCKSTQMQRRSFNPNNRSNHQRRRSAMQSSHSPILELGHSVNSSPELRGASRSPRRRV